jgi:arsenite oxidase large subunit
MSTYRRTDAVPLPPKDAESYDTVCQYCNVGCGYKAYVWLDGTEGGPAAENNAFGVDFTTPQLPLSGLAYTESMHLLIRRRDGRDYHVAIIPAKDSSINLMGNHSSRGGSNAKTTWSDSRPTRVRLHYPLLRVGDTFNAIPWADAVELQARVIKGILDKYGSDQLAAKIYDHGGGGGGYENTYGTGRLLFTGLQMKYTGIHNRPGYSSETWGTRDRGMHELNYTAQDARLADTVVLWGANSYETATVFFAAHMMPNLLGRTTDEKKKFYRANEPMGAARIVIVDPRITATVNAARKTGAKVLHLRPKLGTDYVLANAVARVVWEKKLHDERFLNQYTDMKSFEEYKEKSLALGKSYPAMLSAAEGVSGVPRAQIEEAAEWIAQRKPGGFLRRTLILYEKGIIWNYRQYDAVAAIAQLGALTWNVGRPGTGTGRQGGHQEGYARPPYPGPKPPPDVDKYVQSGHGSCSG